MNDHIRLGVIGPGIAFARLHLPVLARRSDVAIVWLAGTDRIRTNLAADSVAALGLGRPIAVEGSTSFVKRPAVDAVLVAVPISHTIGIVREAISFGWHVFAEKPLGDDPTQVDGCIKSAETASQVLLVGENFRYQQRFKVAKSIIDQGAIGSPRAYFLNDLHFTPPDGLYSSTAWRKEGRFNGGYLIDGGTHIVAGMRSLVPNEIETIHAVGAAFHPEYLGNQIDTLLINLQYSGGMIGHLSLGYGTHDRESRTPKVLGDRATLALTKSEIQLWSEKGSQTVAVLDPLDTGFQREWDLFCAAVRGDETAGRTIHRDALSSILDIRIIKCAIASARSGNVVRPSLEDVP